MSKQRELHELSAKLRSIRISAGLSATELAGDAGLSNSRLSRIENARTVPRPEEIVAMSTVLGLMPNVRKSLITSAIALTPVFAKRPSSKLQQTGLHSLVVDSRVVRTVTTGFIPHFLQTPAFISHVFDASNTIAQTRSEFVSTRLHMQAEIASQRMDVIALIDERVLKTQLLPKRLWQEQLYGLESRIRHFAVEVGVIPDGAVESLRERKDLICLDEQFALYEGIESDEQIWDRKQARQVVREFDRLTSEAVWDGEAIKLINNAIADFEVEIDLRRSRPTDMPDEQGVSAGEQNLH